MPLAIALAEFRSSVAQCDSLIANAHQVGASGAPILPAIDQEQITVAAFLNLFIAWERFLESSFANLMTGSPTVSGTLPTRYVAPPSLNDAKSLIIGINRYFDYANHDNVKKISLMYFQNGYPFEPHISSIFSDLADLKTMRNSSAHITSTTHQALESLAVRIFGQPQPGISLYRLLTTIDPRSPNQDTVFVTYKDKLLVTAELIANG
ncbi:hypothetical protein [Bradyrhizobium sp. AUGA SZCCT0160]|uniref:hypothetical protein n=1 Tax=Bradyrhizobium sp. AUGA SZCCT0160 TaxID=2807662 RepID=UPI001BA58A40|nr:hypothetical protein [Bradyrhizobium sp. AUGA SZCCT0160]MBR1192306.1 hypothetical protein [Bradyrhizobium sp. AUGA SZCCT0160]